MFWFRDLLTNNCIQPRNANVTEGRAFKDAICPSYGGFAGHEIFFYFFIFLIFPTQIA